MNELGFWMLNNPARESFLFILPFLLVLAIVLFLFFVHRSPFKYPYFTVTIDISGKRSPKAENLIDRYLIEEGFLSISNHLDVVKKWKEECLRRIEKSPIKNTRMKQYQSCLDDRHMFLFEFTRNQTRYRQSNYVKTPYKTSVVSDSFSCNYAYLEQRYLALKKIGFECTLLEYESAEQRKLMTPSLRQQIAERDHYTCQICGKYMPDGVGLQIDHIIPIAKGGKTIPSNLRVLCSKCNGKKSKK